MTFSDSLLRLSIKNWAAHQKLPDQGLDTLIRRARFSNALIKRKRLPLNNLEVNSARLQKTPLTTEELLSPLSLAGTGNASMISTLLTPENIQL